MGCKAWCNPDEIALVIRFNRNIMGCKVLRIEYECRRDADLIGT